MFREFNVRLEDVEMVGGSDNLLDGTDVTKVIVRGDNNLSSLDSTFRNCAELDTIDGDLDLNNIVDIDNLLDNTPLVKTVNIKNANNDNLTATNALAHIDTINISGASTKGATQNVLSGAKWDLDNINYTGDMTNKVTNRVETVSEADSMSFGNTLEQKAREIEIKGQTFENIIEGQSEQVLTDDFRFEATGDTVTSFESEYKHELKIREVEGETYQNLVKGKDEKSVVEKFEFSTVGDTVNSVNTDVKQPIVVTEIEGETYQNLVDGKGEKGVCNARIVELTTDNGFESTEGISMGVTTIEGNTVQGFTNCVTSEQFVRAFDGTKGNSSNDIVCFNANILSDNRIQVTKGGGYQYQQKMHREDFAISLKPNTKYSVALFNEDKTKQKTPYNITSSTGALVTHNSGEYETVTFTTTSTGKVCVIPSIRVGIYRIRVVEGDIPNLADIPFDFDLNYIESIGELLISEEGDSSPITLNQYINLINTFGLHTVVKVNAEAFRYTSIKATTFSAISAKVLEHPDALFNLKPNTTYSFTYYNSRQLYILDSAGTTISKTTHGTTHVFTTKSDGKVCIHSANWANTTDEIRFTIVEGEVIDLHEKPYVPPKGNPILDEQGREQYKVDIVAKNTDGTKWNKSTILLPQPLSRVESGMKNPTHAWYRNQYDKLYWDDSKGHYCIEKQIECEKAEDVITYSGTYNTGLINTFNITPSKPHKGREEEQDIFGYLNGFKNIQYGYYRFTEPYQVDGIAATILVSLPKPISTTEQAKQWCRENNVKVYYKLVTPEIIDLPHLNEPILFNTYSDKTHILIGNEVQPSKTIIENQAPKYKPLGLIANKDYTVQLDATLNSPSALNVNLGGITKRIDIQNNSTNKVTVRTPSTITDEYLTLTGENMKVDNVMLFDNVTTQTPSYVEGIESVGELQSDGQYKIDLLTKNNTFDVYKYPISDNSINKGFITIDKIDKGYKIKSNKSDTYQNAHFEITGLNPSKEYRLRIDVVNHKKTNSSIFLKHNFNGDPIANGGSNTYYTDNYNINSVFTPKNGSIHVFMCIAENSAMGECDFINFSLTESSENYSGQSSTTSILLPQQLNKIGDLKDKLYWDEDKGHYCIEKRFNKQDRFDWIFEREDDNRVVIRCQVLNPRPTYADGRFLSEHFQYYTSNIWNIDDGIFGYSSSLYVAIKKDKYRVYSFNEAKEYLNKIGFYVIYQHEPIIVDLPHLNNKAMLESCTPKMYLQTTNQSIQPNKIKVNNIIADYKPLGILPNKDYMVQFDCLGSGTNLTVSLAGGKKSVTTINNKDEHKVVTVRTPSTLVGDRLEITGVGMTVRNVMLFDSNITQIPEYFDDIVSVGELQSDGNYKLDFLISNGSNVNSTTSIILPQPLNKMSDLSDKLYWEDSKGHYCIEQRIGKLIVKKEDIDTSITNYNYTHVYPLNMKGGSKLHSDRYINYDWSLRGKKGITVYKDDNYIRLYDDVLADMTLVEKQEYLNGTIVYYELEIPQTIDLPHLNNKAMLENVIGTSYFSLSNSPMQPSKTKLATDVVKYIPTNLTSNTDYTLQLDGYGANRNVLEINLGGKKQTVSLENGTYNHKSVVVRTNETIDSNELILSGSGSKTKNVMLIPSVVNQTPVYFNGVQSCGVLQDNGKYKIDIETGINELNKPFKISVLSNSPIGKDDILYWDKAKKKYCIRRNGQVIECETVGDKVDLPRLYQKENTHVAVNTGNIKPKEIRLTSKDFK